MCYEKENKNVKEASPSVRGGIPVRYNCLTRINILISLRLSTSHLYIVTTCTGRQLYCSSIVPHCLPEEPATFMLFQLHASVLICMQEICVQFLSNIFCE